MKAGIQKQDWSVRLYTQQSMCDQTKIPFLLLDLRFHSLKRFTPSAGWQCLCTFNSLPVKQWAVLQACRVSACMAIFGVSGLGLKVTLVSLWGHMCNGSCYIERQIQFQSFATSSNCAWTETADLRMRRLWNWIRAFTLVKPGFHRMVVVISNGKRSLSCWI